MERLTETIVNGYGNIIECKNLLCKEVCKEHSCDDCPIQKTIDKLRDYEQAEEDGLLIRLPCKVGDVVYVIQSNGKIAKREADMMFLGVLWDEYGKEWFTTETEAEQALAKMKGE